MKLICFHTSPRRNNILDPTQCTSSSMAMHNGGLPGIYFSSTNEEAYTSNPQLFRDFIVGRQKRYGRFLHEFMLDLSRPHFSCDRLTITKDTLNKINTVAQAFDNDKLDVIFRTLKNVSKNDSQFLKMLIHNSSSEYDVRKWLAALSEVADFIAADKYFEIPADGVLFVPTRPDTITNL